MYKKLLVLYTVIMYLISEDKIDNEKINNLQYFAGLIE